MNTASRRPLAPLVIVSLCLFLLGINGLIGGYLMLKEPLGTPMGLPVAALQRTPFQDFTAPGLWLFFIWGIGSLVTLIGLWLHPYRLIGLLDKHWAWVFTLLIGFGLFLWLTFQLFTLPAIAPIQIILYGLAILLIALPLLPRMRRYYQVPGR